MSDDPGVDPGEVLMPWGLARLLADPEVARYLHDIQEVARADELEQWDDTICDALMAAKHGSHDGRSVEQHLDRLLGKVRVRAIFLRDAVATSQMNGQMTREMLNNPDELADLAESRRQVRGGHVTFLDDDLDDDDDKDGLDE